MNAIEAIQTEIDKREQEIAALELSLSIISGRADVSVVREPVEAADEHEQAHQGVEQLPIGSTVLPIKRKRRKSPDGYPRWSVADDRKVKELYDLGMSDEDIAKELNRTPKAVNLRRSKLDLVSRRTTRYVAPEYRERKKREQKLKVRVSGYEPKRPGYEKPVFLDSATIKGDSHNKPWTKADVEQLKEMEENGYDTAKMADELGRTEGAVAARRNITGMSRRELVEDEKKGKRNGKSWDRWTRTDDQMLIGMSSNGYTPAQIGTRMKRTSAAIRVRIHNFKSKGKL